MSLRIREKLQGKTRDADEYVETMTHRTGEYIDQYTTVKDHRTTEQILAREPKCVVEHRMKQEAEKKANELSKRTKKQI